MTAARTPTDYRAVTARVVRTALPYAALVTIAVLGAPVTPLAVLPVLWVAATATARQLCALLGAAVAVLVLVGDPWPTALATLLAATLTATTVHALATRVRQQARVSAEREHDLATISRVARTLATAEDARVALCRAAQAASDARSVVFWEPQEDGALIATASAGTPLPHVRLDPGREPSLIVRTYLERDPRYVPDVATHPDANPRLSAIAGRPASVRFEPVVLDGAVIGVLAVGWEHAAAAHPRRAARLLPLIAAEGALSIERDDLVAQLAGLAMTDSLTGLGNRRAWDQWIGQALSIPGEPVAIALLDIDRFKAFNDSRGHLDGDRLLKEASAAWRAHLRPGDRLARYGGEEFAVLLPGCNEHCAAIVIERLRAAMPAGQTCSAGVAEWDGHETPAALLRRADAALYAAKQSGRDRSVSAAQLPAA